MTRPRDFELDIPEGQEPPILQKIPVGSAAEIEDNVMHRIEEILLAIKDVLAGDEKPKAVIFALMTERGEGRREERDGRQGTVHDMGMFVSAGGDEYFLAAAWDAVEQDLAAAWASKPEAPK